MEVEMGAETFGLPLEPKAETKCFESCRSGQNRFRFGFASVDFVSVEFFFCFGFRFRFSFSSDTLSPGALH